MDTKKPSQAQITDILIQEYSYMLPEDAINCISPNLASDFGKAFEGKWTDELVGAYSGLPSIAAICECGADKTYGKSNSTAFHSSWCPKGKE